MQIDDLAGNTVKITLDLSDMDGYHVKSDDISGHSRAAELALSRLISCLSEDHDLGLCGERLLVEAFPKSDGGCTLYISCLKGAASGQRTKQTPSAVICDGNLSALAKLCKALKTVAKRASLYKERTGENYRLVIYLPQPSKSGGNVISRISHIISEYRLPFYTGFALKGDTEEYYTLLTENATEDLSGCF